MCPTATAQPDSTISVTCPAWQKSTQAGSQLLHAVPQSACPFVSCTTSPITLQDMVSADGTAPAVSSFVSAPGNCGLLPAFAAPLDVQTSLLFSPMLPTQTEYVTKDLHQQQQQAQLVLNPAFLEDGQATLSMHKMPILHHCDCPSQPLCPFSEQAADSLTYTSSEQLQLSCPDGLDLPQFPDSISATEAASRPPQSHGELHPDQPHPPPSTADSLPQTMPAYTTDQSDSNSHQLAAATAVSSLAALPQATPVTTTDHSSSHTQTSLPALWHRWRPAAESANNPKLTRRQLRTMNRKWSMAEVAEHKYIDDAWIVVNGSVYDISEHIVSHHGWKSESTAGMTTILSIIAHIGMDCSQEFIDIHRVYPEAWRQLRSFYIGELAVA